LGDLPTDILDSLEDLCQETKASDVDDVIQIIIELTKGLTLVIFMDGLDEIFEHERKFVFHHLRRFLVQKTSSVKIFITSREDTSYLTQEPNVRSFKIRIGTNAISSDIESYVKHEVRHLIHRHELVVGNLELEAEIVAALVGGAKGL
jgi:ATP/maltotriose-dependent transcriptional regulator MalT